MVVVDSITTCSTNSYCSGYFYYVKLPIGCGSKLVGWARETLHEPMVGTEGNFCI